MRNPLTEYGLFGWNYWYLIRCPWVVFVEAYFHAKWFIQRGWRGYSDCDAWSLDSYLSSWVPAALDKIKTNGAGYPVGMTPKLWNVRIDRMKDGFLSAKELGDMNFSTVAQSVILQKRMHKGLKMFARYFLSLWD